MYKQFLDYQHATVSMNDAFLRMVQDLQDVVDALKQSFAARGITTQNIYMEVDATKTIAVVNILWQKISFTTRCNFQPQALPRKDDQPPLLSCRIMAMKGSYYDIIKTSNLQDTSEVQLLLDHEVASLFVPAEKVQNSVITIRHLFNKEIYIFNNGSNWLNKLVEITQN